MLLLSLPLSLPPNPKAEATLDTVNTDVDGIDVAVDVNADGIDVDIDVDFGVDLDVDLDVVVGADMTSGLPFTSPAKVVKNRTAPVAADIQHRPPL